MKKLMFALSCFAVVMSFSRTVHAGENVKQCYNTPATSRSRDRVISDRDREDRRDTKDATHTEDKKN